VENLMRLEESMTPEQRALYQQLQQQGVVPGSSGKLPRARWRICPDRPRPSLSARQPWKPRSHALPQTIASRTAELSQPQFLKDAASLAKSYAEPLIAEAALGPGAGIVMGRTRAGKAIMTRVMRPGNQIALWNAIQGAASAPEAGGELGQLLRRAIRASAAGPQIEAAVAP
jgi:hypothetical protein